MRTSLTCLPALLNFALLYAHRSAWPSLCVLPVWLVTSYLFLTSNNGTTPDPWLDSPDDCVLPDNLVDILILTFIWCLLFVDLASTTSKMPRGKPDEKKRSYPKRRSVDLTGSSKFKSVNLCGVFKLPGCVQRIKLTESWRPPLDKCIF